MNNKFKGITLLLAGLLAAAPAALAQREGEGHGTAIVTMLPKKSSQHAVTVSASTVHVRVDGKAVSMPNWKPLQSPQDGIELVLLIDNGARTSLAREMGDIKHFVNSLPPNVKMTIGYMEYGQAVLKEPLTANHTEILKGLHIPMGIPGQSASPYFCLSDLAKHWPSHDKNVRREVLMITNGLDPYDLRYDPQDPYVLAAIHDSIQAHLVVYSIYWTGAGMMGGGDYGTDAGQNLLIEVTQTTGGHSYWQGFGNPVSFRPYFDDLLRRFDNQYELSFTAPLRGHSDIQHLNVKTSDSSVKVDAPRQVLVVPKGSGEMK